MPAQNLNPVFDMIKISDLHFDFENPRYTGGVCKTEEEVIAWMLKNGSILELMDSIRATGYSRAEPVLATSNPDTKVGGYTVVEGNRRLSAVKLLNDPGKAGKSKSVQESAAANGRPTPTEIPTLIYGCREDILDYLGFRHITGVKAWGPRAKAEYLWQIYKKNTGEPHSYDRQELKRVSKIIGSRSDAAHKTVLTLHLLEQAEEKNFWNAGDKIDSDDVDFAVLGTALSYSEIRQFLGLAESSGWDLRQLNTKNAKELFLWLFGKHKIVSESRKLKTLALVVSNHDALEKLRAGLSLEASAEYAGEARENYRSFMTQALKNLKDADLYSARAINNGFEKYDESNAKECYDLAEKIWDYVRHRLANSE